MFSKKKEVKQEATESDLLEQLQLRITALEDKFMAHSHVSRNPIAINETSPYPVLRIEGKDNKP